MQPYLSDACGLLFLQSACVLKELHMTEEEVVLMYMGKLACALRCTRL